MEETSAQEKSYIYHSRIQLFFLSPAFPCLGVPPSVGLVGCAVAGCSEQRRRRRRQRSEFGVTHSQLVCTAVLLVSLFPSAERVLRRRLTRGGLSLNLCATPSH